MYGSTPAESIPIPKTERTKDVYYKNGKEISERHLIEAIMNNDYDEKKEIKYMVNERDMSNHRRTELDATGFIRAEENDKRTPD